MMGASPALIGSSFPVGGGAGGIRGFSYVVAGATAFSLLIVYSDLCPQLSGLVHREATSLPLGWMVVMGIWAAGSGGRSSGAAALAAT